jgi:hypothetical protein
MGYCLYHYLPVSVETKSAMQVVAVVHYLQNNEVLMWQRTETEEHMVSLGMRTAPHHVRKAKVSSQYQHL